MIIVINPYGDCWGTNHSPRPGPLSGLVLYLQVLVMIRVGGSMIRNFAAHGS